MKLFNLDSPVMVFLSKVANLMILNVLTIICCIPIFTAGAAITALYYVTIKMARGDDPYIIKGYFKSFKENFKQATIIWLIMLVILAIIAVDWRVTLVMMTGNSAKIMKTVLFIVSFLLLLTGCGGNAADGAYRQITQEEAKEMMDAQKVIILDVREQDEYDSGHIPGAVLLPVGTIDETTAAEVIPEKDSTVLVYCRSGNRSKTASSTLAELGYSNIYEFGGINTWPYETEP